MRLQLNFGTSRPLPPLLVGGRVAQTVVSWLVANEDQKNLWGPWDLERICTFVAKWDMSRMRFLVWRASRSCRKSVWERHRKSDASQDEKIFFCFYHLVEKIRSFPTMYNTWGCLWGQIDETKHFLQKSGLKTPILAATVLDHPTSKRAETHNFWGIVNFHKCFEKSGT